jgi:quercetin dioxygenase-like cupin family protein
VKVRILGTIFVAAVVVLSAGSLTVAQVPPADVSLNRVEVPRGAYWAGQEVVLEGRQCITHSHGVEFVYALEGGAAVTIVDQTTQIVQGTAAVIPAGQVHTHCSRSASSRILAFQLAPSEASWESATVVRAKRTAVLSGYRPGPQTSRLLEVRLAPQAQTAVHTHPGPESFYILEGPIIVQTEGKLTMQLRGDMTALPGDTPLQARYIGGTGVGRFLALFVVAEGAPFSTPIPTGFKTPPTP